MMRATIILREVEGVRIGANRRLRGVRPRASKEEPPKNESKEHNDLLERINKAKAYKAQKASQPKPQPPTPPPAIYGELERPENSARRLSSEEFRATFNKAGIDTNANSAGFRQGSKEEIDTSSDSFSGSAKDSAWFLPSDEKTDVIDTNDYSEDFMIGEEERQRTQRPEIISIDQNYRPKVSTWGVYPRPANISETYGGGRVIDPTKPLEPEEVTRQRKQKIQAQVLEYKKKKGMYVSEDTEAAFLALYNNGEQLLRDGHLQVAAEKFDEASRVVDFKTSFGGDALLKKAICLDSCGKSQQAKALYEKLTKHPQSKVNVQAKRMLFGFTAMDNLKVTKMRSRSLAKDYAEYFNRMPQEYSPSCVGSTNVSNEVQEFDENSRLAIWMSGIILLLPLAIVFALSVN